MRVHHVAYLPLAEMLKANKHELVAGIGGVLEVGDLVVEVHGVAVQHGVPQVGLDLVPDHAALQAGAKQHQGNPLQCPIADDGVQLAVHLEGHL